MMRYTFLPAMALAMALVAPAEAQDRSAPAPSATPAATMVVAQDQQAAPKKKKRRKARTETRSSATGLARASGSLEQRHQVCLAFIRRHNLDCDPWQTPTCGAETGYFRPPECVRPRSQ